MKSGIEIIKCSDLYVEKTKPGRYTFIGILFGVFFIFLSLGFSYLLKGGVIFTLGGFSRETITTGLMAIFCIWVGGRFDASAQLKARYESELSKLGKEQLAKYPTSPELKPFERAIALKVINRVYPGWSLDKI